MTVRCGDPPGRLRQEVAPFISITGRTRSNWDSSRLSTALFCTRSRQAIL